MCKRVLNTFFFQLHSICFSDKNFFKSLSFCVTCNQRERRWKFFGFIRFNFFFKVNFLQKSRLRQWMIFWKPSPTKFDQTFVFYVIKDAILSFDKRLTFGNSLLETFMVCVTEATHKISYKKTFIYIIIMHAC
jgi:hypothetical protein